VSTASPVATQPGRSPCPRIQGSGACLQQVILNADSPTHRGDARGREGRADCRVKHCEGRSGRVRSRCRYGRRGWITEKLEPTVRGPSTRPSPAAWAFGLSPSRSIVEAHAGQLWLTRTTRTAALLCIFPFRRDASKGFQAGASLPQRFRELPADVPFEGLTAGDANCLRNLIWRFLQRSKPHRAG